MTSHDEGHGSGVGIDIVWIAGTLFIGGICKFFRKKNKTKKKTNKKAGGGSDGKRTKKKAKHERCKAELARSRAENIMLQQSHAQVQSEMEIRLRSISGLLGLVGNVDLVPILQRIRVMQVDNTRLEEQVQQIRRCC